MAAKGRLGDRDILQLRQDILDMTDILGLITSQQPPTRLSSSKPELRMSPHGTQRTRFRELLVPTFATKTASCIVRRSSIQRTLPM